jgi:hypothetical protein
MHSNRIRWSQEQINFLSDVIAAGVLLKTNRLDTPVLAPGGESARVGEVESTFLVQQAFKGEIPSGKEVVVCHFDDSDDLQIATPSTAEHPHEGAKYLLYLRIGINNKFEPTSGVGNPGASIRRSATASPS